LEISACFACSTIATGVAKILPQVDLAALLNGFVGDLQNLQARLATDKHARSLHELLINVQIGRPLSRAKRKIFAHFEPFRL
jgi:hypothetical protein